MDSRNIFNIALSSPGLAIHGSTSALAKTTNTVNYAIDGNIYAPLTAADLPALTGINLATGSTLAITVSVNTSGTAVLTASSAVVTSTISNGIFPVGSLANVPASQALLGYIVIKNASGSTFTGGTTALDAAGLTTTYINCSGLGAL